MDKNKLLHSDESLGPKEADKPAVVPKKISSEDIEIRQMIEKMRKMHDDIEVKLDEVYQKSGLNAQKVKDFLENPNNFQTEEWGRVQEKRKKLLTQIGIDSKQILSQSAQEQAEKAGKDRKTKMLGARRNWIPMR
jgi:hypothetical protein